MNLIDLLSGIGKVAGGGYAGYATDKQRAVENALAQQADRRAQEEQKVRDVALALQAGKSGFVPQVLHQAQMKTASTPIGGALGVPGTPDLPTLAAQAQHGEQTLDVPGVGPLEYSAGADENVLARKQRAGEMAAQHGYRMEELAATREAKPPLIHEFEDGVKASYDNGRTWVKIGEVKRPQQPQGMGEQRQFQREQGLQQDYQQNLTVKDAYGIANAVAGIRAAATGDTPANDLAMMYSLVKFLDPQSAVREGEINLARAARSLGTQFVGAWQKAAAGKLLTPQERQNILGMLDQRVANARQRLAPIQQDFGRRARQFGADSAYVAPDPFAGIEPRYGGVRLLKPGERP